MNEKYVDDDDTGEFKKQNTLGQKSEQNKVGDTRNTENQTLKRQQLHIDFDD